MYVQHSHTRASGKNVKIFRKTFFSPTTGFVCVNTVCTPAAKTIPSLPRGKVLNKRGFRAVRVTSEKSWAEVRKKGDKFGKCRAKRKNTLTQKGRKMGPVRWRGRVIYEGQSWSRSRRRDKLGSLSWNKMVTSGGSSRMFAVGGLYWGWLVCLREIWRNFSSSSTLLRRVLEELW